MGTFDEKFQLYKLLKEKTLRQARQDPAAFIRYIFDYEATHMHDAWHAFMNTNRFGQMLAARGSGKSEQVTVGRALWELGKNPNIRIKIVTEADDRAQDLVTRISATILENEKFKEVFPNCVPASVGTWTKSKLIVKRAVAHTDATVEGSGVLTSSTGGRADLILFDDISGYRNSLVFPRLRQQVKEAFHSNWLNMSDGTGFRWYMVGTPWHIEDIVSELRANNSIPKCHEYWVGSNFESHWPERYDPEYFRGKLAVSGSRHYNRAYRGIALTDEESWINSTAVDAMRDFDLKAIDVIQNTEVIKYVGVDLGHRPGVENCPSVIYTLGRAPTGKRIPCEIRILRRNEPLETARAIIDVCERIRPAKVYVENNGAQKYLIDVIQSLVPQLGLPIEGYFTGNQKLDVNVGIPSLMAEIETGQWIVPLGSGGTHANTCQCTFCFWMQEVKDYPNSHSDALMAGWLALEALRKVSERKGGGFSVWNFRV